MKFFDKIYYINLEERKDRKATLQEELKRVGIRAKRFNAITGKNKVLAFNKSQYEVLKLAGERTLILEDDVTFRDLSHLEAALNELPEDWDMIYLGANINNTKLEKYSEHLFKIKNSFTTHAVGYSKKMAEWIVKNFPYYTDKYEREGVVIYDEWLRVNVQEKFKCFLIAPMVAYQKPDYSNIWQRHADYSGIFEQSNKQLLNY